MLNTEAIKMNGDSIRKALIKAGVKQLREFGYPSCTEEAIMSNYVMGSFFKEMLKGTRGKGAEVDFEIDKLISELEKLEF